jgi:hypothetical protein
MSASPPFWFYVDDEGEIQGPHAIDDMHTWFDENFLTLDTLVCAAFSEKDQRPEDTIEFDKLVNRSDFFSKERMTRLKEAYAKQVADASSLKPTVPPAVDQSVESEASAASPPPKSDQWLYLDKSQDTQGPFTTSQIQSWIDGGFISAELRIKSSSSDADFTPISELPDSPFKFSSDDTDSDPAVSGSPTGPAFDPTRMWYYMDSQGHRRGPWSLHQMRYWASKGFLSSPSSVSLCVLGGSSNDGLSGAGMGETHKSVLRLRMEGEQTYVPWYDHPHIEEIVPGKVPVDAWVPSRVAEVRRGGVVPVWRGAVVEKAEEERVNPSVKSKGKETISEPVESAKDSETNKEKTSTSADDVAGDIVADVSAPADANAPSTNSAAESATADEVVEAETVPAAAPAPVDAVSSSLASANTYQPSEWLYLDKQGKLQGPFPEFVMHQWHMAGSFDPSVRVRRVSEVSFQELGRRRDCMWLLNNYMHMYEPMRMMPQYYGFAPRQ